MSQSSARSGSFNSHDSDSCSHEAVVAEQSSSTQRQSSAPRGSSTEKRHEEAPPIGARHHKKQHRKAPPIGARHHNEAPPKKAKHHTEGKKKQKTSRESSDSESYVTRMEFRHLERTVHANNKRLWQRLEILENKERDSHSSRVEGSVDSANTFGPKPPNHPPPGMPPTMRRVGSFSSSEEQSVGQMVIVLAAREARRLVGEQQPKHG